MKFFTVSFSLFVLSAASAHAADRVTFGQCMTAISIAQQHNNEWQADFSMDECTELAGKAIDDGMALMGSDANQEMVDKTLDDLGLPPQKVRGRTGSHRDWGFNSHGKGSHYYGGH